MAIKLDYDILDNFYRSVSIENRKIFDSDRDIPQMLVAHSSLDALRLGADPRNELSDGQAYSLIKSKALEMIPFCKAFRYTNFDEFVQDLNKRKYDMVDAIGSGLGVEMRYDFLYYIHNESDVSFERDIFPQISHLKKNVRDLNFSDKYECCITLIIDIEINWNNEYLKNLIKQLGQAREDGFVHDIYVYSKYNETKEAFAEYIQQILVPMVFNSNKENQKKFLTEINGIKNHIKEYLRSSVNDPDEIYRDNGVDRVNWITFKSSYTNVKRDFAISYIRQVLLEAADNFFEYSNNEAYGTSQVSQKTNAAIGKVVDMLEKFDLEDNVDRYFEEQTDNLEQVFYNIPMLSQPKTNYHYDNFASMCNIVYGNIDTIESSFIITLSGTSMPSVFKDTARFEPVVKEAAMFGSNDLMSIMTMAIDKYRATIQEKLKIAEEKYSSTMLNTYSKKGEPNDGDGENLGIIEPSSIKEAVRKFISNFMECEKLRRKLKMWENIRSMADQYISLENVVLSKEIYDNVKLLIDECSVYRCNHEFGNIYTGIDGKKAGDIINYLMDSKNNYGILPGSCRQAFDVYGSSGKLKNTNSLRLQVALNYRLKDFISENSNTIIECNYRDFNIKAAVCYGDAWWFEDNYNGRNA